MVDGTPPVGHPRSPQRLRTRSWPCASSSARRASMPGHSPSSTTFASSISSRRCSLNRTPHSLSGAIEPPNGSRHSRKNARTAQMSTDGAFSRLCRKRSGPCPAPGVTRLGSGALQILLPSVPILVTRLTTSGMPVSVGGCRPSRPHSWCKPASSRGSPRCSLASEQVHRGAPSAPSSTANAIQGSRGSKRSSSLQGSTSSRTSLPTTTTTTC
jgi:hypothetical protein